MRRFYYVGFALFAGIAVGCGKIPEVKNPTVRGPVDTRLVPQALPQENQYNTPTTPTYTAALVRS